MKQAATTPDTPLNPPLIPPAVWRKNRDRMARHVRRHMHVTETNPSPTSRLRYDYVVTAAEVTCFVEEVMRDTERIINFYLRNPKLAKIAEEQLTAKLGAK